MPASSLPAPLTGPPEPLSHFDEHRRRRRAPPPAPLLSGRKRFQLAPRTEELMALLKTLHALPHHLPLPPDLRRRSRNAVIAADRIIARLPIEPTPPVEGDSNADFGVGIIVRLALVSGFVRQAFKISIARNLAAHSGPYEIYPRAKRGE